MSALKLKLLTIHIRTCVYQNNYMSNLIEIRHNFHTILTIRHNSFLLDYSKVFPTERDN